MTVKYETQCEQGCELCDPDIAEAERQRDVINAWLKPVAQPCPACRGTGGFGQYNDCPHCGGNGVV